MKRAPLLALLTLLVALLAAHAPAAGEWPHKRIAGNVQWRRAIKQEAAQATGPHQQTLLRQRGLSQDSLGAEYCAVYTDAPFTAKQIADLRSHGIIVLPNSWVPPVPGRHPFGFHLARVPFDSLSILEDHPALVHLSSVEGALEPMNDLGRERIDAHLVADGIGLFRGYDGYGVRLAVADSGIDLTHPDFPQPVEAFDITTGDNPAQWSTNVANTVTFHGTHVTATALGRGTLSNGLYAGAAPAASLLFYKIGSDENARAENEDILLAVLRAAQMGCRVFSLSYGGYHEFMDGSDPVAQAIDAAFEFDDMLSVIAAGNSAQRNRHYSTELAPAAQSSTISMTVNGQGGTTSNPGEIYIVVIWQDGQPGDNNVSLVLQSPLGQDEAFEEAYNDVSPRGTESRVYLLTVALTGPESRDYLFTLQNSSATGETPRVHLYQASVSWARFGGADPLYTVTVPALADTAVAVGAWVHRNEWTSYLGSNHTSGQTLETRATFSSRGPRIDGVLKPDVVAPGSMTISALDSDIGASASSTISNTGELGGSANYMVAQGTSMACPLVAGAAALLFHAGGSGLTASQARDLIVQNAEVQGGQPNPDTGHGVVNIHAAIQQLPPSAAGAWELYP